MDIFVERKVRCPVCTQEASIRYPNPKLYVAGERESDQHILSYKWGQGIHTPVLPHHHHVWQCPHCLYADFREAIENPHNTFAEKKAWQTYQEGAANLKPLLGKLHQRAVQEEGGPIAAVASHLAAYRIASLLPAADCDSLKLGRLVLRLGWLLREMGGGEAAKPGSTTEVQQHLEQSVSELESSLLAANEALKAVRRDGQARSQELGLDPAAEANPYVSGMAGLEAKLEETFGLLSILQRTLLLDRDGQIQPGAAGVSQGGVADFLLSLSPLWPDLPRNEKACLLLAVEWFDLSYRSDRSEQSLEQGLGLITLNVDLLVRTGDLDRAFEYVNQILKSGTNTRWDLQRRLNDGKRMGNVSPHDERMIQHKIATVGQQVEQSKLMRRRIGNLMIEREPANVERLVAANAQRPLLEQEEELRRAGFNEEVCAILKERGTLKEPPKKGGFFSRRS